MSTLMYILETTTLVSSLGLVAVMLTVAWLMAKGYKGKYNKRS